MDLFVKGVSMQQVGTIVETLTEAHPSPSTVSRVFHTLEAEFEGWETRSLKAHYLYAYADWTYSKRQRCIKHKIENVLGYT